MRRLSFDFLVAAATCFRYFFAMNPAAPTASPLAAGNPPLMRLHGERYWREQTGRGESATEQNAASIAPEG